MSSQPIFVMISTVDTTHIGDTSFGSRLPDGINIDALKQIIHEELFIKEAVKYFNLITSGKPVDQIAVRTRKESFL